MNFLGFNFVKEIFALIFHTFYILFPFLFWFSPPELSFLAPFFLKLLHAVFFLPPKKIFNIYVYNSRFKDFSYRLLNFLLQTVILCHCVCKWYYNKTSKINGGNASINQVLNQFWQWCKTDFLISSNIFICIIYLSSSVLQGTSPIIVWMS